MLWAQVLASFFLWIGYGVMLWRGNEGFRIKIEKIPRNRRAVLGSTLLVVGGIVLAGGLFAIQSMNGIEKGVLQGWAWAAITALGLVFVHADVMAAAMLVSVVQEDVTNAPRKPSDTGEGTREK